MLNLQAMSELKESLTTHFPDDVDKIILFGSRMNGNAREYSDYDVLVVLNKDYDWKFEDRIYDTVFDIDLKYDILVDVKVISTEELQTIRGKQPFISDAIEKGIIL
jgi:uncharacterized protein